MNFKKHAPRYMYDCERCKFQWNCGYNCACWYKYKGVPPIKIQRAVNLSRVEAKLKGIPFMSADAVEPLPAHVKAEIMETILNKENK